jgi:hypothetical protein
MINASLTRTRRGKRTEKQSNGLLEKDPPKQSDNAWVRLIPGERQGNAARVLSKGEPSSIRTANGQG